MPNLQDYILEIEQHPAYLETKLQHKEDARSYLQGDTDYLINEAKTDGENYVAYSVYLYGENNILSRFHFVVTNEGISDRLNKAERKETISNLDSLTVKFKNINTFCEMHLSTYTPYKRVAEASADLSLLQPPVADSSSKFNEYKIGNMRLFFNADDRIDPATRIALFNTTSTVAPTSVGTVKPLYHNLGASNSEFVPVFYALNQFEHYRETTHSGEIQAILSSRTDLEFIVHPCETTGSSSQKPGYHQLTVSKRNNKRYTAYFNHREVLLKDSRSKHLITFDETNTHGDIARQILEGIAGLIPTVEEDQVHVNVSAQAQESEYSERSLGNRNN